MPEVKLIYRRGCDHCVLLLAKAKTYVTSVIMFTRMCQAQKYSSISREYVKPQWHKKRKKVLHVTLTITRVVLPQYLAYKFTKALNDTVVHYNS